MRDGSASDGFTLARWVGLATVLPALIAVALLGKNTLMVVERINEAALQSDALAIDRGFKLLGELNGSEVLSRSKQNTAFRNVVLHPRPDWIRENFGSATLAPDGLQHFFIVAPDGRVIFSSIDNGPPSQERVAGLLAVARRPLTRARELYASVRASGAASSQRRASNLSEGLYANDVANLDGIATMITVSPFTPEAEGYDEMPEQPTLLLGVQPMAGKLLGKLEALSHTNGLRQVPDRKAAGAGNMAHPIRDSQGNVVGYVTWTFSPPGYAILRAALPATALSLAFIALLTLLGAVTMRRLTQRLAESEQAARHSARHDTATGLANRGWFMRVFEDLLASADKRKTTYAVLLIDCDYFKSINDTLGHAAGDAVLAAIGRRLKGLEKDITIAARLGGDEFAIVTGPIAADEAQQHVQDIHNSLTASVLFESYVVMVGVSIGAAVFDAPSTLTIDTWLARADMALYRAKRDGRGCARLYDPATDTGAMPLVPTARQPANDRFKKPERAA